MKRLFICAERFFPRGDAGANRVLYIAKAIKLAGWEPIVISIGRTDEKYYIPTEDKYVYEGIEYRNIVCKTSGTARKLERLFFNGKKTVEILKKYNLSEKDKVLMYSSTAPYTEAVTRYGHKVGAAVAMDIVEWHQPFQFPFGSIDLRYLSFKKCFERLTKQVHNVMVISSYLERHFINEGCNVVTVPIYIEPEEEFVYHAEAEKVHLIYPGNPFRKDSLENMLRGIAILDEHEQKKICFHLTGASKEMLERSVPAYKYLLDMPCVEIHGFMDYSELMQLYKKVDFALIARPDNMVTRANFPSKVPELMNKGIPVIINNIGDIGTYLTDEENAILIKHATPESVTEALRQVLKLDKAQKVLMHDRAFRYAKENFDYHKATNFLDAYFSTIH